MQAASSPGDKWAWTGDDLRDPHRTQDKAERVEAMFAAIASSYDLNNRLHSLGRDQAWRKAVVKAAGVNSGDVVVDVAAGTGDLTLAFRTSGAGRVIGIDFTYPMLERAQQKSPADRPVTPSYHAGDAMRLPLATGSTDVVSIAFGIRNVVDPTAALSEFYRVLRPGGRLVVLEFTLPANRLMRSVYQFYFNHIMPRTASWIARDRSGAYRYLPKSVSTFIDQTQMLRLIGDVGFVSPTKIGLTLGIAAIYRAIKP